MHKFIRILSLTTAIMPFTSIKADTLSTKLMLVGGGLKTCSSMFTRQCTSDAIFQKSTTKTAAKHTAYYAINPQIIDTISHAPFWPSDANDPRQKYKQRILKTLKSIQADYTGKLFDKDTLNALWKKHALKDTLRALTDREYYQLLDLLEQPVTDQHGRRIREKADLANTKHLASKTIYTTFVRLAASKMPPATADKTASSTQQQKPKLLVLTASSRDPFEAADFYTDVFRQAGADAHWLPLDASVQAAWQHAKTHTDLAQACAQLPHFRQQIQGTMAREHVYPDLAAQQMQLCLHPEQLTQHIASASGLFINGGDQSLTVKAFKDTHGNDLPVLTHIREKLRQNTLIVGGTSAGTAVMAGGENQQQHTVMIANGRSEAALIRGAKSDQLPEEGCERAGNCSESLHIDDLTYRSHGGLGLFPWGITDTHFSERGRQGRLIALAHATHARWAFGVDEATALLVDTDSDNTQPIQFSVIGQGGVYILDNPQAATNSPKQAQQTPSIHMLSHYLTSGDRASLTHTAANTPKHTQQLAIHFAEWKKALNIEVKQRIKNDDLFYRLNYHKLAMALCISNQPQAYGHSAFEQHAIKINISKTPNSQSRFGELTSSNASQKQTQKMCSYQGYLVEVNW